MKNIFKSVLSSVRRCKKWILTIFFTYWISCMAGIFMVHSESTLALSYRDKIVAHALANDHASINYGEGNRFKAALYDFCGNLFLSSVPQTVTGLSVIIPYFTATYQGWVGGIVSVGDNHASRLKNIKSALYYFIVLFLQYVPYSLAIGSGVRFGVETFKLNKRGKLFKYKVDKSALKDVVYIYILVIPLFFIASCFEFMSTWNV